MMFNDKFGLEQFLISAIADAEAHLVTKHFKNTVSESREKRLEEELCELIETCAIFQDDPIKLQGAVRRHLVGIVNRIVKESSLPEYVPTEEDLEFERGDWLHQERKDREAERR